MAGRPIYKAGENKTPPELNNYITAIEREVGNQNPEEKDLKQVSNDELLQIISTGINDIVLKLKLRLGNNFEESNVNAQNINNLLERLNQINVAAIQEIDPDPDAKNLYRNADGLLDVEDDNNVNYYGTNDNERYGQTRELNFNDITAHENFRNLDVGGTSVFQDGEHKIKFVERWENINNSDISENIKTRLMNCENLEFLYLRKHEEIMKIFAFTINLFDKYKYAIKVILFLLKNLVNKDKDTDKQTVDLPKPIIKNIKKLVDDQAKVQGIINDMDSVINKKVSDNVLSDKLAYRDQQESQDSINRLGELGNNDNVTDNINANLIHT